VQRIAEGVGQRIRCLRFESLDTRPMGTRPRDMTPVTIREFYDTNGNSCAGAMRERGHGAPYSIRQN
jgi:hypothetical protein